MNVVYNEKVRVVNNLFTNNNFKELSKYLAEIQNDASEEDQIEVQK